MKDTQGDDMIDATDTTADSLTAARDIDRVLISRRQQEREEDAKLQRRIRMAMAAKEDSQGHCFYCSKPLDVEADGTKLHPEPVLDCKGPASAESKVTKSGRIERAISALPVPQKKTVELRPVQRPYNERAERD
jgi:hypothetical protein